MAISYVTVRINDHPSLYNLIDFRHNIAGGQPYTHRLVDCDAEQATLYYETDDIVDFTNNIAAVFEENKFSFEMVVHKKTHPLPEAFLRGRSPKIA